MSFYMKLQRILASLAVVIMATAAWAQTPQMLSDNHAMLRVDVSNRYLLLPVQEREEIANVRVIVDNNVAQTFNVKLAADKIDYFVPLDIQRFGGKNLLLDINFHGDRRSTGSVKDFLCWKEMKQAPEFDTANREKFRPAYHHTPAYGWTNDPNGMFYKDGVYHLYFQLKDTPPLPTSSTGHRSPMLSRPMRWAPSSVAPAWSTRKIQQASDRMPSWPSIPRRIRTRHSRWPSPPTMA